MPHKDPAKAKAYREKYRAERREEAKQKTAAWRENNPGRNAEGAAKWRQENPEKAKAGNKAWREENRDRVLETQRAWRLKTGYNEKRKERGENLRQQLRIYGLTQETFNALLALQGGLCAICKRPDSGMKNAARLYVDHCHASNRVRGLLCHACNVMLGAARDKPEVLRLGATYLEQDDSSAVR